MLKLLGSGAILGLFICGPSFGQGLIYGVEAGSAVTSDFNSTNVFSLPTPVPAVHKGFPIGGAILGWGFSPRLSVEANALFRELHYNETSSGPRDTVVTWEFPVLVKYRLTSSLGAGIPGGIFVESGPSFRATGNLNSSNPSHIGGSAGAGVQFRLRPVNVETTVRYTRWRNDNYGLSSRPDQIELLVGFTNATSHLDHPFGNRVSIGGYLGLDLLHDYTRSVSNVNVISINPDGSETFSTQSFVSTAGDRSLMIGPSIEATISHGFSIEAAAIYRHLQQSTVTSDPSGVRRVNSSLQSWQFPILAKYGMPSYRGLTPFIEAGPSFRLPVGLSRFGFSSGLGIDLRLGTAKISPGLRYTRWQTDASGLKNDEADLLIGVRF